MELLKNWLAGMPERKKEIGLVLLYLFLGLFLILLGYFLWSSGRIVTGINIDGVPIGGLKTGEAAARLERKFIPMLQKKAMLSYNQRPFGVVLGAIGIMPDIGGTVNAAYRIGRNGNYLRRIVERIKVHRGGLTLPLKFKHNQNTLDSFYRLLEAGLTVEPIRSSVRVGPSGKVTYSASRNGRAIEIDVLTRRLEAAVTRPEVVNVEIPVKVVKPALTEADISAWKLNQVLGMFSTKFNNNLSDRVHNLKIASTALDNVIIYPGQSFSFNTWVGPRLAETGYKEAPVVLLGKLVPGVGGGVCQVSSTLYNAVLLANLKIVKRQNHTLPSAYIPLGRDATVVYGGHDFIFENTLRTPILLATTIEPPYLRIAVLGEKTDWEKVSLATEILATFPFKTTETFDPALPEGERKKEQEGRNGFKVALWRTVYYRDGSVGKNLENTSIYPAQPEEYKVGKKPEKPERSEPNAPRSS